MNMRASQRLKSRTLVIRLLFIVMIAALIIIPGLYLKDAYANGTVYYAIKANTKFITVGANNELTANVTSIGTSAELFERIKNSDGTYSIKSKSTGKYVTTSSTAAALAATASAIGSSEKFTIVDDYLVATIATKQRYVKVTSEKLYASELDKVNGTKLSLTENVTKLLEITDGGGTSDLQPVIGAQSNISIDTMSMKKFVALRGELDGKYDAIYIGKGIFNPTKVAKTTSSNRAAAHDTKNLENDITLLKAGEIVDNFIMKGQPVYIYNDSVNKSGLLYQNNSGNLYKTFAPYSTAGRDNVVFLKPSQLSTLSTLSLNENGLLNQRPKLVLSDQPTSYLINSSTLYHAGDKLSFHFNVPNYTKFGDGRLTANLYLGLDQAVTFGNDQIVASSVISNNNEDSEISYVLPKGYSGLYYWKLEIVDQTTKLKSYETGVFRYRDQLTKVRVLQVMPNDSETSSLKNNSNLKQTYLKSTDEYEIEITTMKFNAFNSMVKTNLNGTYDMLIFGFTDTYNSSASITLDTANAVNNFIRTGQSVMFTHDTVFSSSETDRNTWIDQFQQTTGQIDPWTNLGLSAYNTSKAVKKVNDGLLNQFPFNLNTSTPEVALTHNQYFTLDLEDKTVVPWYNIIGSNRDEDDSWNHYYTYSKGNVTYSGTGHTNTNFPTWEQQLFVNTMYRAFMGSNHAPMLTVYNPIDYSATKDNFIPNYQNINLSFMPEDYDFVDRNLSVSIKYSYNNGSGLQTVTLPVTTAVSGSTINKEITNPFTDGGDLTIEITVTDKTGAKITKSIPVKVKKVSSNLTVKRTISGLTSGSELMLDRGTSTTMTYTATPKAIVKSGSVDVNTLNIQGITFAETLPAGLEIVGSLPAGLIKSGDVNSGYKLIGNLSAITYKLAADGLNYTASPLTFDIEVKPIVTGTLPLNNSSLTFKDVGRTQTTTLPFDTYSINSIVRLTNLSIGLNDITLVNKKDSSGAIVYDTATVIPTFTPADATPKFNWTSSNTNVATIITTVAGNGYVTGVSRGVTTITVTDMITGKTATAQVTVLESGLNIIGDDTVTAGMAINLSSSLIKPSREKVSSIKWTVYRPEDGSLSSSNSEQTVLTGLKAGKVTLTLLETTTYDSTIDGSKVTTNYEATKDITITNPVLSLSGTNSLTVGDTASLTAALKKSLTNSANITDDRVIQSVTWSIKESDKQNLVSLPSTTGKQLTNQLKALAPGSATVVVSVRLLDNTVLTKELAVTIDNPILSLSGVSTVSVGDTTQLTAALQKSLTNSSTVSDWSSMVQDVKWSFIRPEEATKLAILSTTAAKQSVNTLKALAPGQVTVRVSTTLLNGTPLSADLIITIQEPVLTLTGPESIGIGESTQLTAVLHKSDKNTTAITDESVIQSVTWDLDGTDARMNVVSPADKTFTNQLKALSPGDVTVTVTVKLLNNREFTKHLTITIDKPVLTLTAGADSIGVGDIVKLEAALTQSDHAIITDGSVIKSVTWSLKEADADDFGKLYSTGSLYEKDLYALASGKLTVTVSVKLLDDTIIPADLPVTINNRKPIINGSADVRAGNSINDLAIKWDGAALKPLFTYTPQWSLDDESASTNITPKGNDTASLTTGWNDGATVTVAVKIMTPAGVELTASKQINIVNILLPDSVPQLKQGRTMDLEDSKILKILPPNLRSTILPGLSWKSANNNIVTVSDKGVIKGISKGTTTITMSDSKYGIVRTVIVTVLNSDKY